MPVSDMHELRIISGAQTGVDRAALDAALAAGIDCGGWCPRGRRAEDGRIATRYPVTETKSGDYAKRTRANVLDSEATLIILNDPAGRITGGTRLTVNLAEKAGRPLLIVNTATGTAIDLTAAQIIGWIAQNRISVLNVAGPRESGSPGVYESALDLMGRVLAGLIPAQS